MIAVAVLLAGVLLTMAFLRKGADPARSQGLEDAWARAVDAERSSVVGRVLLSVARPVANLPYVHLPAESPQYKALRQKLNAANGAYGGQVEIFLSVQIAAALLGSLILLGTVTSGASGMLLVVGAIVGLIVGVMPAHKVWDAAKKRADAVTTGLPEFAELLLMPLSSGYGVMPALDFTASRLQGPVAEEVRLMLSVLSSRARSESEAFMDCAERLGTPAAMSFFTALMQAYLDGVKVADNLRGQASALRKAAHERTRGRLKMLPNHLVFIIALHLLPMLFIVGLMPTLLQLGNL